MLQSRMTSSAPSRVFQSCTNRFFKARTPVNALSSCHNGLGGILTFPIVISVDTMERGEL